MLSFFTILLILVGANALFMVFSLTGIANGVKKFGKAKSEPISSSDSQVYPIQPRTSELKKVWSSVIPLVFLTLYR